PEGLRRPGGLRPGAGPRADRAPGRSRLLCRLHADPLLSIHSSLRRARDEHPSLAAARVSGASRPTSSPGLRREDRRSDGALPRGRGGGHRIDHSAIQRARSSRRHRGHAVGANLDRRAQALPRGRPAVRRGPAVGRGAESVREGPWMKVRRALISVHDKTGLAELAQALAALGVEILSTGGTAKAIRDAGVRVVDVSDATGFPEMLDGRVKTLHPKIHGAILARRDVPEHLAALDKHGITPIDLVVSSLYPFEQTVARPGVTREEAIEQIDVGGPTMIRAAAKNHTGVAVVTSPSQYGAVLDELRASGGSLSNATSFRLAQDAFRRTAQYDAAISAYLDADAPAPADRGELFPAALRLEAERVLPLRYGENPHQEAAFYGLVGAPPVGLTTMKQLHGPELGYNNLLDFSAALSLLLELEEPAGVVIKHTNPCGAARAATVGAAMTLAKASDPVSIYGGIVGVNRTLDAAVVEALAGVFVEILFAPAFAPDALEEIK